MESLTDCGSSAMSASERRNTSVQGGSESNRWYTGQPAMINENRELLYMVMEDAIDLAGHYRYLQSLVEISVSTGLDIRNTLAIVDAILPKSLLITYE